MSSTGSLILAPTWCFPKLARLANFHHVALDRSTDQNLVDLALVADVGEHVVDELVVVLAELLVVELVEELVEEPVAPRHMVSRLVLEKVSMANVLEL
eukprot:4875665-Prorocentrum_lima.AAC.1